MSFVNRVRSTVRASTECWEESGDSDALNGVDNGMSRLMQPRPAHTPPDMDRDELDGEGARGIFGMSGSIFAARIVGANSDFCSLFGLDRTDLAMATFKILQGPLTNTKHLQEMWSDVRKGSDKTVTCNLYHKNGDMILVKLEAMLRRSDIQLCQNVVVLRFSITRQCSPRYDPSVRRPNTVRKMRVNLTSAPPTRTTAEMEMERLVKRLEGLLPPSEMERLRKAMDNMIPKAKLEAAEAEIARLKRQLEEGMPTADLERLKRQMESMVPKEQVQNLEIENERLQKLVEGMVPTHDLKRAEDHLHEAQEEVNRLKKMLDEMEMSSPRERKPSDDARPQGGFRPPPFARQSSEVSRAIAGRASNALREVFPRSIADAIMEGRTLQPICKECVSVFFSDVVGFTTLSSTMEAAKVSDLLNRLFAKFDALAEQHGVQKMDVIGDAYLAATNVMEDQSADHAARIARFAIDAMAAAQETRLDEEGDDPACVQIRIGIHCGAVSASVLGAQGFKYTLLGDTVNTASRMESTSLPCEIQCSESSARLITLQAPDIALTAREGGVEVKGKGHMNTFWVSRGTGANSAAAFCGRAVSALCQLPGVAAERDSLPRRCAVRPVSAGRLSLRASRDRAGKGLDPPILRH